jgi:ferric-dicitrate binding protein FerR (iron transport regulator)
MKPGELVELENRADRYLKKKVNPQVYTSWKNKILLFDNTPLKEVALNLEETYGLEVQLSDASLSEMKVSGSTPIDNLDVFFAGLSKTFDLQITKEKNRVVIRKRS